VKLPIPHGRRAILVLGVPLGLAAAGAFMFVQMSSASVTPPVPDPGTGEHGAMLALESRVINLANAQQAGAFKYAKIAVTIELRPGDASFYTLDSTARGKQEALETGKVADDVPLLLDAIGSVVSSHDSATLNTVTGRAGLKEELLSAARKILGQKAVINVYITDFVMQ
jgi:flagellar basal body-associated protein FliL